MKWGGNEQPLVEATIYYVPPSPPPNLPPKLNGVKDINLDLSKEPEVKKGKDQNLM